MNILYYICDKAHSTKGGTERTTITMASALTHLYGCKCFSIYERPANTPKEDCFVEEFLWTPQRYIEENSKFLRNIIVQNKIDCVIVQGAFIHVARFRAAVKGLACKVIFAHHFEPRWELVFSSFTSLLKNRPDNVIGFCRWVKNMLCYPVKKHNRVTLLSNAYHEAYDNADNVVLLSKEFIKDYSEFCGLEETSKFRVIPNGLSFEEFLDASRISCKKNIVLIVARLDERQKRLSSALRIWAMVKQRAGVESWKLNIVGHGEDLAKYEQFIRDERIPEVHLLGRQNPIPYYKEASIFMMTSRSESWGLTLTEAQQFGVVPMAFDTYASLQDIITNGENGLIVPDNAIDSYAEQLYDLMMNEQKRWSMAANSIDSCKRFAQEVIAEKWWNLLNEVVNQSTKQ